MSPAIQDGRFYGRVVRFRPLGDLVLSETAYEPDAWVPWHSHESPLVCLVLRGALDEHQPGGRRRLYGAGTLFFHPRHEPHAHRFRPRSRCFSVSLGSTLPARLDQNGAGPLPGATDLRATRAAWLARQLYGEFERGADASSLTLEGLVLAVVGELTRLRRRERARRPGWIVTVRDLIEARFREAIGLAELADEVGVHPVHVARTFRREFGCSIGAYVRRRRVEHACRALLTTEDSLASIAVEAGFADQGHFSRRFKELIGLTPGVFRAQRRSPDPPCQN
jgi:AraC family transcriptional regulator